MIIQTRFVLFTEVVLQRFRADNFNLKDEDCSDRPATTNMNFFKTILAENSQYNVQKIVGTTTVFQENGRQLSNQNGICQSMFGFHSY